MESCKCPITGEIFEDPVVGDDGHTYERKAITDWLATNSTSPMTRQAMDINSLRTNYAVKKMIEELQTTEQSQQTQFQLDVDIRKTRPKPLFQGFGKFIYEVEWINRKGPPIILMKIEGAKSKREASFYVQLSCHPHIVRTFGLVQSNPGSVMLLQEAAPYGDLSEHLRENGFRPNEQVLWEIFKQVCEAMICLADNAIVHGDLTCRNVLVFQSNFIEPRENLVKLTGFGLTKASNVYAVIPTPAMTTMTIIPVRYAAPEILRSPDKTSYSEQSDVYSMGVLMWEACSYGQLPYSDLENDEDVRKQKLNDHRLIKPPLCSQPLWETMNDCWQQDPSNRPTFKRLREVLPLHHITSGVNSSEKTPSNAKKQNHVSISINEDMNTDAACIPCEFCGELVPFPNWTTHTDSCLAEEHNRLENLRQQISRAEITTSIPCEYCSQLCTVDQLEKHQRSCSLNQTHADFQRGPHHFKAPKYNDQQNKHLPSSKISNKLINQGKNNQSSDDRNQARSQYTQTLNPFQRNQQPDRDESLNFTDQSPDDSDQARSLYSQPFNPFQWNQQPNSNQSPNFTNQSSYATNRLRSQPIQQFNPFQGNQQPGSNQSSNFTDQSPDDSDPARSLYSQPFNPFPWNQQPDRSQSSSFTEQPFDDSDRARSLYSQPFNPFPWNQQPDRSQSSSFTEQPFDDSEQARSQYAQTFIPSQWNQQTDRSQSSNFTDQSPDDSEQARSQYTQPFIPFQWNQQRDRNESSNFTDQSPDDSEQARSQYAQTFIPSQWNQQRDRNESSNFTDQSPDDSEQARSQYTQPFIPFQWNEQPDRDESLNFTDQSPDDNDQARSLYSQPFNPFQWNQQPNSNQSPNFTNQSSYATNRLRSQPIQQFNPFQWNQQPDRNQSSNFTDQSSDNDK